jgi:hypothetical protein
MTFAAALASLAAVSTEEREAVVLFMFAARGRRQEPSREQRLERDLENMLSLRALQASLMRMRRPWSTRAAMLRVAHLGRSVQRF